MSKLPKSALKKNQPYLFFHGLLIIPSFFMANSVMPLFLKLLAAIVFAFFAGRKIRLMPLVFLGASIVLSNIITPFGKVLFYIADFPVTAGALGLGVTKFLLIAGLFYVSLGSVNRNLVLPGAVGLVFANVLFYSNAIAAEVSRVSWKNLVSGFDGALVKAYKKPIEAQPHSGLFQAPVDMPSLAIMFAHFCIQWAVIFFLA